MRRLAALFAVALLIGGALVPVRFVPSTDAPTHLGRFRSTPPEIAGGVGGAFLSDVFGLGARQSVELAFGADLGAASSTWEWTDVTSYVRWDPGITLSPMGRQDESPKAQPAGASLVLLNTNDEFTLGYALSPYWPNIKENTPIRIRLDIGNGVSQRFFGYVNGFTPRWDETRKLALVDVKASGVKRRLKQGTPPVRGAFERRALSLSPVAQWPLRDGPNASVGASVVSGQPGFSPVATVAFSRVPGPFGAPELYPEMMAGESTGNPALTAFVTGDTGGDWTLDFMFLAQAVDPLNAVHVPIVWNTADMTWVVNVVASDPTYFISVGGSPLTGSGATISADGTAQPLDGEWHHVRVTATFGTPSLTVSIYLDGEFLDNDTEVGQAGRVTTVTAMGAPDQLSTASIGQVSVHAGINVGDTYEAFGGYVGETATDRLDRLCDEEGVFLEVVGTSDAAMGPQPIGNFLDLCEESELVDGGTLLDGFNAGFTYICRTSAYANSPGLTLDASLSQFDALVPRHDDQGRVNDFTAEQLDGTSARHVKADGALGTDDVGVYDSSDTVNMNSAADLVQYAAWRTNLGTNAGVRALRYPSLRMQLAKPNTALIAQAWLNTPPMTRVDAVNMLGTIPSLTLLLQGWTEHWNSRQWDVTANLTPYEPWRVVTLAQDTGDTGEFLDWLETDDSKLTAAAAVGATSLTVATNSGPIWSTTADDFPLVVEIQGVPVTVTSISGASSPQTFTVDGDTVVKALPAGSDVVVYRPTILGL